ncbi:MAG: LysR family transcriptional regulator [Arenicella sp.]
MNIINEKRVVYLYEAVTQGTVRAAADKLNISASAVSRQISLLEKELSVTLIERHRKGVTPTEAGDVVLMHYRNMIANEEDCLSKLGALQSLHTGHVSLAIGEGFVDEMMSGPLAEFHQKHPDLTVSVSVDGTNEIIRKVEFDEAHLGILFHPTNSTGIRSHVISKQAICAIVHPDHVLAGFKGPVEVEQLLAYPLALQEKQFGVRQLLAMAEFQEGVRFAPRVTTNSIAALKQFALSNSGVTFLPAFVVAQEIREQKLCAVDINHAVLTCGEIHLITRIGRQLAAGPLHLLQYLNSWMRSL